MRHLRDDRRIWWGAMVTSWFWLVGAVVVGLLVPSTGITDYAAVSRKYAEIVAAQGGTISTATEVPVEMRPKENVAGS